MDTQTKKFSVIGAVVGVLVVAGLVVFGVMRNQRESQGIDERQAQREIPASPDPFRPGAMDALPTVEGGTRKVLQKEVAIPEPGATSTPQEVAVPKSSTEISGQETNVALRNYEIKAEAGAYQPSTIIVRELDIVTIEFTAVDDNYNMFFPDFGVYREAKKGETKKFQFQATAFGEFKFFCNDCKNKMEGTLIVNKKGT